MIKLNVHFINGDTASVEFNEQAIKKEHRGRLTVDQIIAEVCDKIKTNGFIVVTNTIIPVNNIKLISVEMPVVKSDIKKDDEQRDQEVEDVAKSMWKIRNRKSKHD